MTRNKNSIGRRTFHKCNLTRDCKKKSSSGIYLTHVTMLCDPDSQFFVTNSTGSSYESYLLHRDEVDVIGICDSHLPCSIKPEFSLCKTDEDCDRLIRLIKQFFPGRKTLNIGEKMFVLLAVFYKIFRKIRILEIFLAPSDILRMLPSSANLVHGLTNQEPDFV